MVQLDFAEGIKTGKWMEANDNRYVPTKTNFASSSERNKADGKVWKVY